MRWRALWHSWPIRLVIAGIVTGAIAWALVTHAADGRFLLAHLGHVSWPLLVLAALLESGSLASGALLQRVLLGPTGARPGFGSLFGLTLATDAIADSLPGEPLFSSVLRFQQYRRHGASPEEAGWVMAAVLVALAIGLSILLAVGALGLLDTGHRLVRAVLVGSVVAVVGSWIVVRTDVVARLVRATARLAPWPRLRLAVLRLADAIAALRLTPASAVRMVIAGVVVWGLDLACLAAAFAALQLAVPWRGLVLAYGTSQILGVLPVTPGGLGVVEGSLTAVLVAFGSSAHAALAGVLMWRVISYWLLIPIGWAAFLVLAYRTGRGQ